MEKRRTWSSFCLATGVGMAVTLLMLLGGEHLLQQAFKDLESGSIVGRAVIRIKS